MKAERYSTQEAAKHAQQHQQQKGGLPHHLRCDWVRGEPPDLERCSLATDHQGEHQYSTAGKVNA